MDFGIYSVLFYTLLGLCFGSIISRLWLKFEDSGKYKNLYKDTKKEYNKLQDQYNSLVIKLNKERSKHNEHSTT